MKYREWEESVPAQMKDDSLWRVEAYRLSLFAGDIGWQDTLKLAQDYRLRSVSDQLYRSLGSVSANIAEGYSRGTSKDRAHFYEYALGSARESLVWYYRARQSLEDAVFQHRLDLQGQIIRLLLVMVPQHRGRILREDTTIYTVETNL